MNEDLIEKIALFIERQCPRKLFPSMNGSKCDKYGCSVHWMAAQVRDRKFETDGRTGTPLMSVDVDVDVDVMR